MKTWTVQIPITGYIELEVEAESAKAAIEIAMSKELTAADLVTWETHTEVVKGNVFYGVLNKANAEEFD